ncbi:MAG: hypothetical protein H6740_15600 [Alphaproteobacteria bacterium]|nr:hypothetical protein [Alphaproteobacteria bacterium]
MPDLLPVAGLMTSGISLLALSARHAWVARRLRRSEASNAELEARCDQVKEGLREAMAQFKHAHAAVEESDEQLARVRGDRDALRQRLTELTVEVERTRKDAASRTDFREQVYRVVTIGLPKTGKTSITLKWANPLWEFRNVQGTSFDRYTRTVSSVVSTRTRTVLNHVFEVFDFGGEHIIDAHNALITQDVHGLLFVVDLAEDGAEEVDPVRIAEQIRRFNPDTLRFFFESPQILQTCRTVVLFINKSDLIPGKPSEIEAEARRLYQPLIDAFRRFDQSVELSVIVGSATSGHNTHVLMPHFVRRLLPEDAFDDQLIQQQRLNGTTAEPMPGSRRSA